MSKRLAAVRDIALILAMLPAVTAPAQNGIEYEEYIHLIGGVPIDSYNNHIGELVIAGNHAYVTGSELWVVDISDPGRPAVVGGIDESCSRVVTSGNNAFVVGGDLMILNIADPHDPQVVGTVAGPADDVAISGDLAFIVDGGNPGILSVVDISDPTAPMAVGSVGLSDGSSWPPFSVTISGDHAFIAGGGLDIVDITDPVNPEVAGHLDVPGELNAIAVAGDCAYVLTHQTLHVIGIADPTDPQLINNLDVPLYYGTGLSISDNCIYVTDGWPGLQVLDITNPETPVFLVNIDVSAFAQNVTISNDVVFVSVAPNHMMPGTSGLLAISVPAPVCVPAVGSLETPGIASDVAVSGNYCFVAGEDSGLQVAEISDPQNPQIISYLYMPGETVGVAVSGNRAFVVNKDSGLHIIDVADPANPRIIGHLQTPGTAQEIELSGDHAFIADGEAGLQVVDISNLIGPQIVAAVATPGSVDDVSIFGDHAYITDGSFHVVDISDPANPWIAGSLAPADEWSWYDGVGVSGDKAYVTRNWMFDIMSSFEVVDISDPSDPYVTDSTECLWRAEKVVVADGYAYVSTGGGWDSSASFHIADLSDPEHLRFIGSQFGHGGGRGMAVTEDHVYTARPWKGLLISPLQGANSVRIDDEPDEPSSDLPQTSLRLDVRPNPFNPQTTVTFSLPRAGWADVSVYDLSGRQVTSLASRLFDAGQHTVNWNGSDSRGRAVPSGTYIVRLETDERVESSKVMLVR